MVDLNERYEAISRTWIGEGAITSLRGDAACSVAARVAAS